MLQTGAKGLQPCDLLGAHVEVPLVPVPTGTKWGVRDFCPESFVPVAFPVSKGL
jgi:hypothetical protein